MPIRACLLKTSVMLEQLVFYYLMIKTERGSSFDLGFKSSVFRLTGPISPKHLLDIWQISTFFDAVKSISWMIIWCNKLKRMLFV